MSRLALVLAALVLAGCGGGGGGGSAEVWVTRDRGARVLHVGRVPAGLTAMQALRRVAKVETRYGGRFVQAIDGIHGSLAARRDWFYFVNGYEADRGAAEYRLRAGDVEWWDYRSWRRQRRVPVVVGAFPEPFLHGYDGRRRAAVVRYAGGAALARAVGRMIGAADIAPAGTAIGARNVNVLVLRLGRPTRFEAEAAGAGAPVRFVFVGDWRELVRMRYRYRYEVRR